MSVHKVIAPLVALLFIAIPSAAQSPTGRIVGTITDESAAAIPGVVVSVRNLSTGVRAEAQSNQSGIYNLLFLEPGRYELTADSKGFRRYHRPSLTVETGQILSLDVSLKVGDMTESVTVTDSTPLVQSDTSSINQLIENATIRNMPLASRRGASLIKLMGNVTFASEESWEGIPNFSMAGGRGRQQLWTLDGGNMQAVSLVTGILMVSPPVEALQEIKVEANGYPAEFGRTMGGYISMTTKSGTNQFHGVLYHFLRNNALDARSFFSPEIAPRKYNVFGATIGGPIRKDKTHFFFSYEGTRRRDGITRIYNVPTVAEVGGDFSASTGSPLDPVTGQPFPGKVIPLNRQDPVGRALAALYPAPNVPGAASGVNNFRTNVVNQTRADSYIAKLDHVLSLNDRLSIRYFTFNSPIVGGKATPEPAADPNGTDRKASHHHLTGTWFRTLSPTKFNELRLNYSTRGNDDPLAYDSGIAGRINLKGVDPVGMPRVNVTGFTSLGWANQFRAGRPQTGYQITDAVTIVHGAHNVKIGGEWRYSGRRDNYGTSRSGAFSFNDVAVGRGFAVGALLLGWVNSASAETGDVSTRMDYYSAFIQDDWKVTPRLTLNIGLRWEMDTPRWEKENQQSGFDPTQLNPVSGTPGVLTFAGREGVSKFAHNFDKNNVGPRFGFAWRPFGVSTVVRGAYGIMYGPIYDSSVSRALIVGFGDTRSLVSSNNGLTPAFLLKDGVPSPATQPIGPGFGAAAPGRSPSLAPDFFDPNQAATYAHHVNMSIQKQFLGTYVWEIGYTSNLAHRVGARDININEIRPELRGAVQNQALRPFPQYSGVTLLAPNWGNSSYHALNLKVEKRFSGGLNFLTNYTWSKFLDDVESSSEAGGAPGTGQQSFYARALDKSLSGNDVRHRISASVVYELPVGQGRKVDPGNRTADAFIGGWSIGAITEMRTGLPYGVTEASNRLNSFSASQRSNLAGDPVRPTDRPRSEMVNAWFDTSAFAFPGNGNLGTAARNVAAGPGLANVDLSLLKNFGFGEQRYVQLRGEFFNALNRPNFGLPNTSRGAAAFGTISSTANEGRIIQIGLRLVY
ncbi:MAG: carboxypeptidase regulatory-like domain-containing protein [Bryobacteraceae bacterium]|nr:carboxypeptidase regulatory-like domain-containing protein [Bryobacteraceae bacterium]